MRHLLWIPMLLVGLMLLDSLTALASGSSMLWSVEFVLLVLVEAVLFGAWVVACEVAWSRETASVEADRLVRAVRELRDEEEEESEE